MESVTIRAAIAANFRAARARAELSQETVAARMRALGFSEWQYQTVGKVERGDKKGGRRLTAEEIIAAARALETTVFALMRPEGDGLVRFPSGDAISARSIALSAAHHDDQAVIWNGSEPQFSPESGDVSVQILVRPHGFPRLPPLTQTGATPA
jgi:transcriptional regulator with XRE-family HTH domain